MYKRQVLVQNLESGQTEKYLLTTAHSVKHIDSKNSLGHGPTLKKVLCRKPLSGFVEFDSQAGWPIQENDGIWVADVIDPFQRPEDDWSTEDCRPEKDWVLLKVIERDFQGERLIAAEISTEVVEPISIIGFPGGSKVFSPGNVLENRVSREFEMNREGIANDSMIRLEGPWETGPGMSGGGVFNERDDLIALYRGQNRWHLTNGSIRISAIRNELANPSIANRALPKSDIVSPLRGSKHRNPVSILDWLATYLQKGWMPYVAMVGIGIAMLTLLIAFFLSGSNNKLLMPIKDAVPIARVGEEFEYEVLINESLVLEDVKLNARISDSVDRPEWMIFDTKNGRFSFTPKREHVGEYPIQITASKNMKKDREQFILKVRPRNTFEGFKDEWIRRRSEDGFRKELYDVGREIAWQSVDVYRVEKNNRSYFVGDSVLEIEVDAGEQFQVLQGKHTVVGLGNSVVRLKDTKPGSGLVIELVSPLVNATNLSLHEFCEYHSKGELELTDYHGVRISWTSTKVVEKVGRLYAEISNPVESQKPLAILVAYPPDDFEKGSEITGAIRVNEPDNVITVDTSQKAR